MLDLQNEKLKDFIEMTKMLKEDDITANYDHFDNKDYIVLSHYFLANKIVKKAS